MRYIVLIATLLLSGCSLWPYKSDFDCKVPKGQQCKSLYQINKMTDEGKFDPNLLPKAELIGKCKCLK